ncbi:hypothetical protein [Chryseobacterium sp. Marseille-Q3244]|nr:hypothetical protein [Chryseobacterium sp. Marseille-Q3244]
MKNYETRVYKINEDFVIELKTEKYINDELISEKEEKYKIDSEGKIILH